MKKGLMTFCGVLTFLCFFFVLFDIDFVSSASSAGGCSKIEREALLEFKNGLTDASNRLSSWTSADDADCCQWYGVVCDNFTGHVLELHLGSLSEQDDYIISNAIGDYVDYLEMVSFGGNISRSLLNLKHLKYLDLSNSYFQGIQIPEFLGSMVSLTYLNLSRAGFGGLVPHQLGNLSDLQWLDLNGATYYNFNPIIVDSFQWLSGLSSLEYLDLSSTNFNNTSDWLDVLNTLPSLVELHLSGCQFYQLHPPFPQLNFSSLAVLDLSSSSQSSLVLDWVFDLKNLISLDLSSSLHSNEIPIRLRNLTSLRELDLSSNGLNSSIPNWLLGFAPLEVLRLGSNSLQGRIPTAIGNMTSLNTLVLSGNNFQGEIPIAIGNLTFLDTLALSDNNLEGGIPQSFRKLCNLRSLDLSNIKVKQEINEVFEILSQCAPERLESLVLPSTELSGRLPYRLGQFRNLVNLIINDNSFSGQIPEDVGDLKSLTKLYLENNKLNGSIPGGFGTLSKLEMVHLFGNSFKGEVSESHFTNLTNLRTLDAHGNQLLLSVKSEWTPPFQRIRNLALGSWQVGPLFPTWIRSLKHLKYLDLSNSGISATLPNWFLNWTSILYELNLSRNQIHGTIPYLSIDDSDYSSIDLSSNNFHGPMPLISSNPFGLDLSNNSFSGSISSFLCDIPRTIEVLNLGDNLFSGEISDCWMNWDYVSVIRLSNNYFNGSIPKSIGLLGGRSSFSGLSILNLANNNLSGEIPFSLGNCTGLEVLDLSENQLGGRIPIWIGQQFGGMRILNLRGNTFRGIIPEELCGLSNLQILDLSDNNLKGSIPRCIDNLLEMVDSESFDNGYISLAYGPYPTLTYSENSKAVRNGKLVEYSTILNFVRSLDLSKNELNGEIPEEITSLGGLQFLNLSHNSLEGRIPKNIGAIKELQLLDLSQNQLSGEIPSSMASLTFLNNLNLSNNRLSGIIPSSTQLQSMPSSSFSGNNLCGPPLTRNCSGNGTKPDINERGATNNEDDGAAVDWFYVWVSIAPGFAVGFWWVIGPLVFYRRWRHLYFSFLYNLWDKIWLWFHFRCACHHNGE